MTIGWLDPLGTGIYLPYLTVAMRFSFLEDWKVSVGLAEILDVSLIG
jgi:hypothetical protein